MIPDPLGIIALLQTILAPLADLIYALLNATVIPIITFITATVTKAVAVIFGPFLKAVLGKSLGAAAEKMVVNSALKMPVKYVFRDQINTVKRTAGKTARRGFRKTVRKVRKICRK